MRNRLRSPTLVIGVAIALSLLWRLALAVWIVPAWESANGNPPFPDHYPTLARSLVESQTLGYGPYRGAPQTTVRGPGFPLWLALGMLIGGFDGRWLAFWASLPILILAPFLLNCVWKRYGGLPAACAFSFLVFHPLPGFLSARVMSDEFYAACGFGAFLIFDSALRSKGPRAMGLAVASGLLLSMAILTRTSGLLLLIVLLGVTLWIRPFRPGPLMAMAALALALPLAWSVRTSRLEGRPVFVHSLQAYNFWVGEGFERYGYSWTRWESWGEVLRLLNEKANLPAPSVREFYYVDLEPREAATLERALGGAALRYVAEHPLRYGWRVVRGLGRFWIQAQSTTRSLEYFLLILPVSIVVVPAFFPIRRAPPPEDRLRLMCVLAILTHMLAYAMIFAMARFSVQVYPQVAFLLGAGIPRLRRWLGPGKAHPLPAVPAR